jgi:hypothetical protein
MFKKSILVGTMSFLFLFTLTSLTFAYNVTTVGGGGYGPYQTGLGGEFTLLAGDGLGWVLNGYAEGKTKDVINVPGTTKLDGTFQTFCVEENEYIYPSTTLDATISNGAINGGKTGGDPDPLSIGTAWLYYNFATGGMADYIYSDHSTAGDLQNTIWWLEGEAGDPGATNVFRNDVLAKFTNEAGATADNNGQYKVAVLNLWQLGHAGDLTKDANGNYIYVRQDQLVVTPIPGALLLLGPGLIGLVGIRRRMAR